MDRFLDRHYVPYQGKWNDEDLAAIEQASEVEWLWKFLRKKVINLYYYPLFDEFKRAVLTFFDNIKQHKSELNIHHL